MLTFMLIFSKFYTNPLNQGCKIPGAWPPKQLKFLYWRIIILARLFRCFPLKYKNVYMHQAESTM
jgi:hypothetical protein